MMMKDVHPQTAFIMNRAQCVIYADNTSVPATVPLTRILAMNKNLLMIDNRDRFITKDRYMNSRGNNDFVFAAITNTEPWEGGNIFCCSIYTPDNLVEDVIKADCASDGTNSSFMSTVTDDLRALVRMGIVYLNSVMKMSHEGNVSSFQLLPYEIQQKCLKAMPEFQEYLTKNPQETSWGIPHPGWLSQLWLKASPQYVSQFAKAMYGTTMDFSKPAAFAPGKAPTPGNNVTNNILQGFKDTMHDDVALAFKLGYQSVKAPMAQAANAKMLQEAQQSQVIPPEQNNPAYWESIEQTDFFGRPVGIPKAPQGGYAPAVAKQFPEDFGYHAKEDMDPAINPNINPEKVVQPNGKVQVPQNLDSQTMTKLLNTFMNNSASNFAAMHPNVSGAYVNGDGGVVLSYSDGSISPVIKFENESKFGIDTEALDQDFQRDD